MVRIGYTMMTEQAGPRELVSHVVGAEEAGFDFSVVSDHSFPWLRSQGHASYAWSVLGAAAQATSRSWKVNPELPGPAGFEQASQHTRPEDVAEAIACGDDVDAFVDAVRPYAEAGFTEVALVQIGGDRQKPFLAWAEAELLPALRDL
ncbi:LLM class flavin-dependent oxidoreductase [Streptomyces sp. ISL-43]|uniref:LLM class flavin-dependent oxidoreductase n=1 Tax=Streptomyces sp. ISL-43 TaxID=2819183 RepID=UPI001BED32EA|nr:LLM class flavin-dependent oxidoreductase [Streptomyces sp. ISL-43]MBT2452368.1 LLM class flavin-dependent oxidoreductase [Streptomyces sp. ISL-43]